MKDWLRNHPQRGVFAFWLASRLWVALWVYLGHLSHPYRASQEGGYAGVDNWWLNPWTTFDSYWYLRIAKVGFEPLSVGFFPFYSLLLRLAGTDEIITALWGLVLSNLCFGLGLWGLFQLTRLTASTKIAWGTVALTAFFPISAVFSAVYTESLFFALLVWTFLAYRRQQWALAALLGFMTALTRNAGPIVGLALLLESPLVERADATEEDVPKSTFLAASGAALTPFLGFLAVQSYLWLTFHGLGATKTQELYGRALNVPWLPIWRDAMGILSGRALDITTLLNLAATLLALFFIVTRRRKQRPAYTVLLSGIILAQLTLGRVSPPYTNSSLRFLMTTFPFTQNLARLLEALTVNRFRLLLSTLLVLMVCALMSFLFGQKQFVTG